MKKNNIARKIIFFSLMLISNMAFADLELELTQGTSNAIPIAINQFAASGVTKNTTQELQDIMTSDFKNSGRLKPVESGGFDLNFLQSKKVDHAVTGTIQKLSENQIEVSFLLHDVYKKTILLDKKFTIEPSKLRKLTHHIDDLIYEKITGNRGIFSTRIAYILVKRLPGKKAQYSLEVADADGFNPRTLLTSQQPIMSPSWSKDGKQIAYVSFEGNRSAIYIQNIATGARKVISNLPGINGAPSFSPDGKTIALVLTNSGNPKISLMDLNTNRLIPVTQGWAIDTEPCFTPDGRALIFTSSRGGNPQIYKIDIASKSTERLTYNGNYNARASISADAKNMVMLHQNGSMFNIGVQDLQSGRFMELTQTGYDESPSIAPNGSMVVYATTYNGRGVLAAVSIDGRVKLLLPSRAGEVQEPAWSPFLD